MRRSFFVSITGDVKLKPLKLKLHWKHAEKIREMLEYEERRVIRRCNILNCLNLGYTSAQIAAILNVNQKTVTNVGQVYLESGLNAALHDDERSGRPVDIDDRDRSRIVAMVCSDPPAGHDLIVDEIKERGLIPEGVSRAWVQVLLQEHDLKPWLEKMWCVPKFDQEYIDRMERLLDTYELPYDENRPVVCIDEKPVALFADARPREQIKKPGDVRKVDYEYKRNGSVNVFCGVEPKKGVYFNKVTPNRCAPEFADFLKDIADAYPAAEKITLVMDNLSTHKKKSLEARFLPDEVEALWSRFDVIYTPKHASWLNQAEIAIGMYSRQSLGDGRVENIDKLRLKTEIWNRYKNEKATKIEWRFTKSKARKSFGYSPLTASTFGKT
jgi:transposase